MIGIDVNDEVPRRRREMKSKRKTELPVFMRADDVNAVLNGNKTRFAVAMKDQPEGKQGSLERWAESLWTYTKEYRNGYSLSEEEKAKKVESMRGRVFPFEHKYGGQISYPCPYGRIGDRLWVRETFQTANSCDGPCLVYRADKHIIPWEDFCNEFGPDYGAGPSMDYDKYPGDYSVWCDDLINEDKGWKSPMAMPRWASRIDLVITDIRIERLQDATEADAVADGCVSSILNGNTSTFESGTAIWQYRTRWDERVVRFKDKCWDANPWVWVVCFKRVEL